MKCIRILWLFAVVGCGGAPTVEPTSPPFDEKQIPAQQPQNPNAPKFKIGTGPSPLAHRG